VINRDATYRTSIALADLLATKLVFFPGDHGALLRALREFADRLQEIPAL
jgi:hypothetical protein